MELTISVAKKEDLQAIINIANTELGLNYLTTTLSESLLNPNFFLQIAKFANSEIVGFSLCIHKTSFVLIKSIAVSANYKNKGIATLLIKNCLENYKNTPIKCIAWQSNKIIHLQSILIKQGFIQNQEIPNYWKEDSIQKQYNCPTCGKPPCLCTAVVFEKTINNLLTSC